MTEEQIKLNAEKYAGRPCFIGNAFEITREAHIAGAHSMLKEIEQLKESKRKLRLRLMQQIHELRNPWTSVEDRLPKEGQPLVVVNRHGNRYYCYYNASIEEFVTLAPDGDLWNVCGVTHWMPIPEFKKGGEI